MNFVIVVTVLSAFGYVTNNAYANWLARCESANGLRYCKACGLSGLEARNNCFHRCGPDVPVFFLSPASIQVFVYCKRCELV
jgi:hypothetical protein